MRIIKRFLASNKYFWKYRHKIQPRIFDNHYGKVYKAHFKKILKKFEIKSVLDFGCATGDKLDYFLTSNLRAKFVYGIDVNQRALDVADNKLKKITNNFELSNTFDHLKINEFLNKHRIKKFDLIIFDRVLYILNDKEFFRTFINIIHFGNLIYVDDFFLESFKFDNKIRKSIRGYTHTDFNKILTDKKYMEIIKSDSLYSKVLFANAMFALYKKM